MEIGYAYARRRPIYAIVPIPDPFLKSLITGVVSPEGFSRLACA
jgi:hypothetical protein